MPKDARRSGSECQVKFRRCWMRVVAEVGYNTRDACGMRERIRGIERPTEGEEKLERWQTTRGLEGRRSGKDLEVFMYLGGAITYDERGAWRVTVVIMRKQGMGLAESVDAAVTKRRGSEGAKGGI